MPTVAGWNFDHSYARLPTDFYACVKPRRSEDPKLAIFNRSLANSLGLCEIFLESESGIAELVGSALPETAHPIAQAYAGHQYGHFTMLGDGRAILLGEHLAPDGSRLDIQLKGAGQTPYSRRGDGLAALGPMLREFIISEYMHAVGIPTTRSLAVVMTGSKVIRQLPLPGAVLTRVAKSHIRVGTFEYAAARGNVEDLRKLADYTINRHFPDLKDAGQPYQALLETVVARQASLVANWMMVGFVHGVMNTDNMAISGETIDFGPCAFMDVYDPGIVFSSIDHHGRYAYKNQPHIAQWNLARFAETLLPLLADEPSGAVRMAENQILLFPDAYRSCWLQGMRNKLGLTGEEEEDVQLIEDLLHVMRSNELDFTNTFVAIADALSQQPGSLFGIDFLEWHMRWKARANRQEGGIESAVLRMSGANPSVIPRNHLVEQALEMAEQGGDFSLVHKLIEELNDPYRKRDVRDRYCTPPSPQERVYETFCGT